MHKKYSPTMEKKHTVRFQSTSTDSAEGVSTDVRQTPLIHDEQAILETQDTFSFVCTPVYSDQPASEFTNKDTTSDWVDPTLVQLGESIVTTAIQNAVAILQRELGEGKLMDGVTAQEIENPIIDVDENLTDDVNCESPSDKHTDIIESVEEIQESRKRLRNIEVSDEMEEFSSDVKRSREESVSSLMIVSPETGIDIVTDNKSNTVAKAQASASSDSNRNEQNSITHQHPLDEPMDGKTDRTEEREKPNLSDDVSQWTEEDVRAWLLYIGMGKYQEEFHDVCGVKLLELQKESLYNRGVTSQADIECVMKAISTLHLIQPSEQTSQASTPQNQEHSFPPSVYDWCGMDVIHWLQRLGEQYTVQCGPTFQKHEINGHVLIRLTDSTLKRLGINDPFLR
jgi:hypothetical protein